MNVMISEDVNKELAAIKQRLEALEQRVYTIISEKPITLSEAHTMHAIASGLFKNKNF